MELSTPKKDPNVEVADIVREASGGKVSHDFGAFESRQDKLLRKVMTEVLDNAKAYREKAHDAQTELRRLYTAESFFEFRNYCFAQTRRPNRIAVV